MFRQNEKIEENEEADRKIYISLCSDKTLMKKVMIDIFIKDLYLTMLRQNFQLPPNDMIVNYIFISHYVQTKHNITYFLRTD